MKPRLPLPWRARQQRPPPAEPPPPADLFATVAGVLKAVLGLSGVAYLSGFIVANARFLSLGVAEANLLDARYVAIGALFLFVALPVTVFPYVRGLAGLNRLCGRAIGRLLSEPFDALYQANQGFFERALGPFLVTLVVLAVLPELAGGALRRDGPALLGFYVLWYAGSLLVSRVAVVVFNLGFYWRLKMLLGEGAFWAAFKPSFIKNFVDKFNWSFAQTQGRAPTQQEVQDRLNAYVLGGMGAEGFLTSALYKGIALFVINAVTFATLLFPLLPASIGGGKPQTVVLLLAADKSGGLDHLGLRGQAVATNWLSEPVQLLAKTSEAYFVQVPVDTATSVVRVPAGNVVGVTYRAN